MNQPTFDSYWKMELILKCFKKTYKPIISPNTTLFTTTWMSLLIPNLYLNTLLHSGKSLLHLWKKCGLGLTFINIFWASLKLGMVIFLFQQLILSLGICDYFVIIFVIVVGVEEWWQLLREITNISDKMMAEHSSYDHIGSLSPMLQQSIINIYKQYSLFILH